MIAIKRIPVLILFLLLQSRTATNAQEPLVQAVSKELFAGPGDPSQHKEWLEQLKQWRVNEKKKINYDNAEYLKQQFWWVKKTFIYAQMMAHDRYFYDPVAGKYTVDRYLDDLKKRYGGLDAVLIWPTYPNMGIDNRNQFDLVTSMPGGIGAIKQMIVDFKKRGVRVFFPIMIWDHGTRKIEWQMPAALVKEMKLFGADGLNGDTMSGVTEDFKNAYDSLDYPIALQPEWAIKDLKALEWNVMSWGYFWNYTYVPGVSINKWLEPGHQVHVTNRWAVDKTDDLQYAFFNGIGYNSWENVWGVWNQIADRYEEIIRRISKIYHEVPYIWSSYGWEPHIPTLQKGIFASKFPGLDKTIYTLVNRDSTDKPGRQLQLPYEEQMKYFDIWNGVELIPQKVGDEIALDFNIEGRGFGAVMAVKGYTLDSAFYIFLNSMHISSRRSLKSFSEAWKPMPQQIVEIKKTTHAVSAKDMVLIPAVKEYHFESNGVMIEGDRLPDAVGIQHPWEKHPSRSQKYSLSIPAFYIDKYPTTNEQFKKFLDATHYVPRDKFNFLKDWNNGMYPTGWAKKPVTWISIEDARAFAAWAGKRLPHEWEWQYAAQGEDNRLYPWGNKLDSTKMPLMDSTRDMRIPTNVDAFSNGVSPFGVYDMVGNIWQWTDEYTDEHTRAAVLKGGGYYRSTTSKWYFPRAFELNKYGKYLLMAPAIDRSALIGFRCVMDK